MSSRVVVTPIQRRVPLLRLERGRGAGRKRRRCGTRGRRELCNNEAARLKFSSAQFHRAIVTSPSCTLAVPHNCRVPARLIESKLMPVTGRTSRGMMAAYRTHKSSGVPTTARDLQIVSQVLPFYRAHSVTLPPDFPFRV